MLVTFEFPNLSVNLMKVLRISDPTVVGYPLKRNGKTGQFMPA